MLSATEIREAAATAIADADWSDANGRPALATLFRQLASELLALLD